jgi:CelD/BcsL family acetyltransferase involved in cellulose biosynthesis
MIEEARPAGPDEWDTHWLACRSATYFQSRLWAETWAAYRKGQIQPDARLVRFADGSEVVLPLSRQRLLKGLASRWWCCPMTTYGGWLSPRPLTPAHVEALCAYAHEQLSCVTWRMNPYEASISEVAEGWEAEPDETLTISLLAGYDEVYRGCAHGHRRAERKAERLGVQVRPAASHDDWSAYVAAYQDSLRRWGEPEGFSPALFAEMERRAGEWSTLWVAEADGAVVGGLLCLYGPRHVACWHSAVLEAALSLRPMPLVFLTAIRDACERGLEWFDFNPSRGLTGVEEFKRRFGAQPRACPVLVSERGLGLRAWRLLRRVRVEGKSSGSRAAAAARP